MTTALLSYYAWSTRLKANPSAEELDGRPVVPEANKITVTQVSTFLDLLSRLAFQEKFPNDFLDKSSSIAEVYSIVDSFTSVQATWDSVKSTTQYRNFRPLGGPSVVGEAFRACLLLQWGEWEPNLVPAPGSLDRPAGTGLPGDPLDAFYTSFFAPPPGLAPLPYQHPGGAATAASSVDALPVDGARLPKYAPGSTELNQHHFAKQVEALNKSRVRPWIMALRNPPLDATPPYADMETEVMTTLALNPTSPSNTNTGSLVPILAGAIQMKAAIDRRLAPGTASTADRKTILQCMGKLTSFVLEHLFSSKFRLDGFKLPRNRRVPFGPTTMPGLDSVSFAQSQSQSDYFPDSLRALLDALRDGFKEKFQQFGGQIWNPFTRPQGLPDNRASFGLFARIHGAAIVIASHSRHDIATQWMALIEAQHSRVRAWYQPGTFFRDPPEARRDVFGSHMELQLVPRGNPSSFKDALADGRRKRSLDPICFRCGRVGHKERDSQAGDCTNPRAARNSPEAAAIAEVRGSLQKGRRRRRTTGTGNK